MNDPVTFGLYVGLAVACGLFAFASLIASMAAFDSAERANGRRPIPRPGRGVAFLALAGAWIVAVGYFVGLANVAWS